MGTSLTGTGTLGWGRLMCGWHPLPLRGCLCIRDIPPDLFATCCCGTSSFLISSPHMTLYGFFFISLVIGLLFSQFSVVLNDGCSII